MYLIINISTIETRAANSNSKNSAIFTELELEN